MHNVEPKIFLIGKSVPDKEEIRQWLDSIGATEYKIEDNVTGGEQLVQLAGKRCYMSFQKGLNPNITRVRTDMIAFINNILKVGHGSVLEHVVYNFAIENVSRVFTGEMNRHRAGMAISEGSMRYIRFDDIPYWIPTSIQGPDDRICLFENGMDREYAKKKRLSRWIFKEVFSVIEEKYKELQDIWKEELSPESKFHEKKQITSMMRRIIPMGVASGGFWSGNLRALRHVFTMRCNESAEEEIMMVACQMLDKMIESEPIIFSDFYKNEKGFWQPKYKKV